MPAEELVVFRIRSRDSKCSECGEEIGKGGLLRKEGEKGLCLVCADLDHLDFLPPATPP
jgi:formylmethanofuran dehydrogenase subunit E